MVVDLRPFAYAPSQLGDRVAAWGYREDRAEYEKVLASADVFVSTARHEFFGLTAVEAMALGARPLLPDRLAYPELLELAGVGRHGAFLYDGSASALTRRLLELARAAPGEVGPGAPPLAEAMRRLHWRDLAAAYDDDLEGVAGGIARSGATSREESRSAAVPGGIS